MDRLQAIKQKSADIVIINKWLDSIGEYDEKCREEVISQCMDNDDARKYYVQRYEAENSTCL